MLDNSIEPIQTEKRQALLREGSSRSPPSSFQHFDRGGRDCEPLEIPYAVPDVTERAKAMIETVSTNSSSILLAARSVFHSVRSPAALAESAKNLWQNASGGMQGSSSSSSSAPITIRATRPRGGMAGTAARIIFSSWFQYYYCAMILINIVAMADNLIEKVCPELNLTTNLSIHNTHKRADAKAL